MVQYRNKVPKVESPMYLYLGRPDMTFAVDWALKTNYLSILAIQIIIVFHAFLLGSKSGACMVEPVPSSRLSLSSIWK